METPKNGDMKCTSSALYPVPQPTQNKTKTSKLTQPGGSSHQQESYTPSTVVPWQEE